MADISNTQQISTWNQLLGSLHQAGYEYTLHQLTTPGTNSENLRPAIADALRLLGVDDSQAQKVWQSAPRIQTPVLQKQEEETAKKKSKNQYAPGGNLINHSRYESEILDNIAQQQQNRAALELDGVRTMQGYFKDEDERKAALQKKFDDIVDKNATLDKATDEQHQLLVEELENSDNTQAAETIRSRAGELKAKRAEEKDASQKARLIELDSLEKEDVGSLAEKVEKAKASNAKLKLTLSEEAKIKRYKELKILTHRDRLENEGKRDTHDVWKRRFAQCKTPQEQDALLRKFLQTQQNRTRNEVSKVFDKKIERKNFFTGKVEKRNQKTLSRKERRNVLAYQKAQIHNRSASSGRPQVKRNFFDRVFQNMSTRGQNQPERKPTGGISLPNPFKTYRNARSLLDVVNLGKGAAGLGEGAGAAVGGSAPIWPWILLIVGILVVLVLIVLFIGQNNAYPGLDQTITAVTCGDLPDGAVSHNSEAMRKFINDRFHILISAPYSQDPSQPVDRSIDAVNVTVENNLYNTMCLLFGHIAGDPYFNLGPTKYNTFGNLVVGTQQQRDQGNVAQITYTLFPQQPDKPCSVEKDPAHFGGNNASWKIINPELCLTQPGTLEYFFAQSLGKDLIAQQTYLHKITTGPYNDFLQNIFSGEHTLPTIPCSITKTPEDCFADMVSSYLVWGEVFQKAPSTMPTSQPTVTQPTGSQIQSQPLSSFLGQLGIFPQTFSDYYSFARSTLFDNQDLFSYFSPGTCPTTSDANTQSIAGMTTFLKSTFNITLEFPNGHNSNNLSFVQDIYSTICTLSKYTYIQKLQVPQKPIVIRLTNPSDPALNGKTQGGCSGHSTQSAPPGGETVDLLNQCFDNGLDNPDGNEFVLTHELGHILQWRNWDTLFAKFCTDVYGGHMSGGNCNYEHPNTIPGPNCIGEGGPNECFSDMVGVYVVWGRFLHAFNNYPKDFPIYYNFARDNVFTPFIVISPTPQPTQ